MNEVNMVRRYPNLQWGEIGEIWDGIKKGKQLRTGFLTLKR